MNWLIDTLRFCFLAHAENVQFSVCTSKDEFKTVLTHIEQKKKKNASLTCVFGPARGELERHDLRQSIIAKK